MVKKLLGDAVREERLRRNLSQNSLAEQAKISLRTVSDIENYIGNPQLETLYADVQEHNYRIGSDIPSRYYRIYYQQRDKLTANQGQVTQARPEDYA